MKQNKPHPLLRILFLVFLASFFGGGLLLFLNLFFHFFNEAAFAIIALVIMAEFLLLLFVGICVRAVSALRSLRRNASDIEPTETEKEKCS
jgi:hypothetical protein